jgi:alpha-ribazole phosphatase
MKLWLVRHAQPLVEPGVCYGALDLAADGAATQAAATALAAELPRGLPVWVSPLQRCEQLALSLQALRPDLTFKTDARLAEMNFGQWEGVPWAQIPAQAVQCWTDDFGDHLFGGVESANAVLARVAAAWNETRHEAHALAEPAAVWLTHAGVIRAARLVAQGQLQVQQAAQWPTDAPGYGGFCVLGL